MFLLNPRFFFDQKVKVLRSEWVEQGLALFDRPRNVGRMETCALENEMVILVKDPLLIWRLDTNEFTESDPLLECRFQVPEDPVKKTV